MILRHVPKSTSLKVLKVLKLIKHFDKYANE